MKKEEPCDYIAYTDGSANNLSPYGEGGSAYIIIKEGRIIHSASKALIGTTNNRAELLAIMSAVNWIPAGGSVEVHTDSQYCINMLRNITRPLSKDTINLSLIERYRAIAKHRRVAFVKVKGHSGNMYNEMADRMAGARTEEMRKSRGIPLYNIHNSPKVKH